MNGRDTAGMRFQFLNFFRPDLVNSFNLIFQASLVNALQDGEFFFFGGQDYLAANVMGYVMFFGKGHQLLTAIHAVKCFV